MKDLLIRLGVLEAYAEVRRFQHEMEETTGETVDQASINQDKCWQYQGKLIDIHAKADMNEKKCKLDRDNTLADKKNECEEKTATAKEQYAKSTIEYREACIKFSDAEAFKTHIEKISKFFEGGVFVKRSRQDKEARSWQATPTQETK